MSLWVSILSYGAALLGVALVAVYLYFGRKHDHWKRKGVKHLKPLPFVGNMKDVTLMRRNLGVIYKEIYDKYKREPYMGLYAFDEPVLQIHDLNLIKAVLVKDFEYFCDRNFNASPKVDPLGSRSLFALKGDRWRHSRNALTPTFTSGKMKRMYQIIDERGKLLQKTLQRENDGKPITVYELAARYTTDVIASCAFGIESGTLDDPRSEFRRKMRQVFELSPVEALRFVAAFLCPKLMQALGIKVLKQEVEDYVTLTIKQAINHREQNAIKREDLLDSLIEIIKGGDENFTNAEKSPKSKIKMDEFDVAGHSMTFLAAGFETSATTMSYALYELAKHTEMQDRVREEINTAAEENGGSIPYDVLHGMKYLEMVFQETLRKYPPVPFIDRVSNKPYKLPGTDWTLEAGTVVMIPTLAIHRDPEFFPNPMEFNPERFSEEKRRNIRSCTHMPFGEGPRTCVGLRFAVMQTKIGLVHILKKYSVHPANTTPKELDFTPRTFLLQPQKHVQLIFRELEV